LANLLELIAEKYGQNSKSEAVILRAAAKELRA
jgi:hypothetical protein